jgi:2-polyprenyl-3-methyl-5-hydroxy-6-metoxy-1,4-benzoquinol methylase
MLTKRDYNKEMENTHDHNYVYNFDFNVIHGFMIKSFEPFFIKGNILELGSFKGDFTKRLMPFFEDITCVEASNEAIVIARKEMLNKVNFINKTFEEVDLEFKYDNIILTHVLEHIDDPVALLKRINNEWLSGHGRLFLVCPNANAASRQIAVKMGLISHNSAVTPSEAEHGHKRTYSLDSLERDILNSDLKIIHKSGIFFKALANFQWDKLLQTDIISKEYLEGCFKLGQEYPDLCSSVFFVCEKGAKIK